MRVSFVDLRKKSGEVIRALGRNERVTVLYRGKPAAVMCPIDQQPDAVGSAKDHIAFGLWADRDDLKAGAAVEANRTLITGNDKHYKAVKELDLKRFRP